MADLPAVVEPVALPWYSWRRSVLALARLAGLTRAGAVPDVAEVSLGADYASGSISRPSYSTDASMAAYAAFPWVYAALLRASGDFAGRQLQIVRGRGRRAEVLDDHEAYEVLESPHSRWTGRQLRRQGYVDLRLTGNFAVQGFGGRRPIGLQRLHPSRMGIDPDAQEGWGAFLYNDAKLPDQDMVFHARLPSWEDDPRGLWGTGGIQALHADLTTDKRTSESAAKMAKRGRPDVIVSPDETGSVAGRWNEPFRRALKARLDQWLTDGGTVVVGGGAKIDVPSWTPRDMEFPQLRQLVREAVLAVTGVPPHMVGLPSANYALAERQELVYWEMLQAYSVDVCDAMWTPIVRRYDRNLSVRADFSDVDVLQSARTARQSRAQVWWMMGMPAADAAAYEGFDDAPAFSMLGAPAKTDDGSSSDDGDADNESEDRAFRAVAQLLVRGSSAVAPAPRLVEVPQRMVVPTAEADRAALWSSIMLRAHSPSERALAGAATVFLSQQRNRLMGRLDEAWGERALTRDVVDDVMEDLYPDTEAAQLAAAMRSQLRAALVRAFGLAATQVALPLVWAHERVDETTDALLGSLVTNVDTYTHRIVRDIVTAGLRDGLPLSDVRKALEVSPHFGPARALRIARTEATRSVTAGSQAAWRQAEVDEGVVVRQQWLSARDDVVRDTHATADGETVAMGEDFVLSDGDSGSGPGELDLPENVVNCRCTLIPVVIDT